MLQGEHSAITLTIIKLHLPFVIEIFILSIFERPFYTDFTAFIIRGLFLFWKTIIRSDCRLCFTDQVRKKRKWMKHDNHFIMQTIVFSIVLKSVSHTMMEYKTNQDEHLRQNEIRFVQSWRRPTKYILNDVFAFVYPLYYTYLYLRFSVW